MLDEAAVRREKREKLRAQGQDPYPAETLRNAMCSDALLHFDEWSAENKEIVLAGRVRAVREHGGASFIDLEDESERLQLHLKKDELGAESYDRLLETIDHGDFIETKGTLFLTKRGQQTLAVTEWKILSKALLPLPAKWHGLSDIELRYRKRYLDLLANPEVKEIFKKRSLVVKTIREFLDKRDFMEVETPILQTIAGGASARPFITHHNTLDIDLYLRIAPELFLKRLIVGGFEKVYEIARCFRNEGISFQHNPEFTQVEFYWAYANYEDLMNLTEEMIVEIVKAVTGGKTSVVRDDIELDFTPPFPRRKFYDLVKEETGIDLEEASDEASLLRAIENSNLKVSTKDLVGYGELADQLYKDFVRPNIVQPTFVIDYPAEMIPLAKRKAGDPKKIATMQLLVQGIEVCKAYNELNDPLEQEARFKEEEEKKGRGSEEAMETDADFIEALKYGMPPTAGFGMGIDRLTALLTGSHSIKEVILFPTMKPQSHEEDAGHSPDPTS